jgi:hypothetical protein
MINKKQAKLGVSMLALAGAPFFVACRVGI